MRILKLLSAMLLFSSLSFGQGSFPPPLILTAPPAGACADGTTAYVIPAGLMYYCANGWRLAAAGGASPPVTRTISTTLPLTGGGDLSADRTLNINNFGGDGGGGGTKGTVPAPAAGDAASHKFLSAGGSWVVPTSEYTPPPLPIPIGTQSLVVSFPNEGSVGTTAGLLVKVINDPPAVRNLTTSDTQSAFGVCTTIAGSSNSCGTTGSADIAVMGRVSCQFDGATTANDYVISSTSSAGKCKDAGTDYPVGVAVIGTVLSTNGGSGTYEMNLETPDVANVSNAKGGGGKGTNVQVGGSNIKPTANFNNTTPAAPAGSTNVTFQTSDSGATTRVSAYVPAANLSWTDTTNYRYGYIVIVGDSSAPYQLGEWEQVQSSGGSAVSWNVPDATFHLPFEKLLTSATANQEARSHTKPSLYTQQFLPGTGLFVSGMLASTTNQAMWIVLTDPAHWGDLYTGPTYMPTSWTVGFYNLPAGAATNWFCYAGTTNVNFTSADSGVLAVANAKKTWSFTLNAAGTNILYYINGTQVCDISTNLPVAGSTLGWALSLTNTQNEIKEFRWDTLITQSARQW